MYNKIAENESLIVKSLSTGNILAFNTLFRDYSGKLYRFANRYLRSEPESEELVQEVFKTVWEKRAELKEELSFKSFLFTIAFNIIKKHFRRKDQILNYHNSTIYDDLDMRTSQQVTCDSLHQYINELVSLLPEKRKKIFIKSRFEGLSITEISEEFKLSHKTIENQLTHALKFMRKNLKKEGSL